MYKSPVMYHVTGLFRIQEMSIMSQKIYLIDLDHTLIDSTFLFQKLHDSMNQWLMNFLHCTEERALAYRTYTWRTYGATFQGLWIDYRVAPDVFFEQTHSFIRREMIPFRPDLYAWMMNNTDTKILYTNSPQLYAYRILKKLKIQKAFQKIICAEDMIVNGRYSMKPSIPFLKKLLQEMDCHPSQMYFFDDTLHNLQKASTLGIQTVWCYGFSHRKEDTFNLQEQVFQPNYTVDYFLNFFE